MLRHVAGFWVPCVTFVSWLVGVIDWWLGVAFCTVGWFVGHMDTRPDVAGVLHVRCHQLRLASRGGLCFSALTLSAVQ
jgi:hypothetical protein